MGQNLVGLSPLNKITTYLPYSMSKKTFGLIERKIIRALSKLPSDHLHSLVDTQEQIRFWRAGRCFQEWVAQSWEARYTGKDDPLKPLLKSGEVNQDVYDRVWLAVDFYEQLWGLVQLVTPYIQQEFEGTGLEFLSESAFKLFLRLVWNEANEGFAVCLKPYHEASSRKYEQAYRLGAKGCREELNPIEERKLHGLLNQHQPDMLMRFVVAVAHQKATRKRLALKSKLEMFYMALGKLCEKEATISRKLDSFAWKNGKLGRGDKDGTYKFS
jgi:hypothetical protein